MRGLFRPAALWVASAVVAALIAVPSSPALADTLLSQGKTATASSSENGGTGPANAVDGNTGTRWSSASTDSQWLQVDLGASAGISRVVLTWEAAYGSAYKIQASENGITWTDLKTVTGGDGGADTWDVTGNGRYVRMLGTTRATGYGYSLWEFQVFGTTGGTGGQCGTTNAALNKPAGASSTENGGTPASAAFDGDNGTRWASATGDAQWVQVDLGSEQTVCKIGLRWEAAYASAFKLQGSVNGTTWNDLKSVTGSTGGVQSHDVSGTARYVRMQGVTRATGYGYSLWEFSVQTTSDGPVIPGGGPLGPNVHVFDPSMSSATIQSQLDAVFAQQESAQFGTGRHAFLFKPGTYNVNAKVGFYTSIIGLGQNPDDVTLNGVTVDAGWFGGNATQNFWRSTENLSVQPPGGTNQWAVSQAAPFRRMHIKGALNLAPTGYGWASGGYIADSKIDGAVGPYSQQQWYTRDSSVGGWVNGVWNMVFSGVQGAPATNFLDQSYTTLDTTPISREKPYLYFAGNEYRVFVPSKRTDARGVSWANGATPGTSLPLGQFFVAKPGDSAATINAALAQGLHLLLTPGIYNLSQPINVTRANTVVLGLGLATIIPGGGAGAVKVADVDGVKLAGFLVDAGTQKSDVLIEVGPQGSSADHAANPTTLQDVFVRIGGAFAGNATTSVVVNSDDVIIDHTWLWRGDHGDGIGWNVNTAETGLVVNGDDVLATGLFVEHYRKYDVEWYGERGRTIFFQNEKAYDPPNQAAYMNGSTKGWAAYKVGPAVNTHEGWGLGSYVYFNVDPTIEVENGFETPVKPGVKFHSLLTVSLGGNGRVNHVINGTGGPASGTATIPSKIVSYP
ncbi:discoidin domain-containing protein [Streptosporangium sp. NBC_01756]|uniref:discoidin domain-containing protein n=1 Tax=Streptosporangium sp. NBC_01756 TaxID=2975950 RepID=UPI002DDB4328|nr:discoidin domain-containing protein [Streptosporangium sp. NBC_01756]WSC84323.1 discoidin domain-containing protein [Streptosporangium sp. NBC_01756]